jgi:hypothetical protein
MAVRFRKCGLDPVSGDFLPKHRLRHLKDALCVCFVAILWARDVGKQKIR